MSKDKGTQRKTEFLGMHHSRAKANLQRNLLWKYICKAEEQNCYKCGEEMSLETYSIDHKKPWLYSSKELFWDLTNISFSHKKCNKKDRPRLTAERRVADYPEGTSWCSICKQFLNLENFSHIKDRWNNVDFSCKDCNKEQRRKNYLKRKEMMKCSVKNTEALIKPSASD